MKFEKNIPGIKSRACKICKAVISDSSVICMNCGNRFVVKAPKPIIKKGSELVVRYSPTFQIVFPFSSSARFLDENEPLTKKWLMENIKDDWTVIDCGANMGVFTVLFSMLASKGQIFAFEPTENFDVLKKNMDHFVQTGLIQMPVLEKKALGACSGFLKEKLWIEWGKKQAYKTFNFITIDDYVELKKLKRVDLLKIDVDGFDFEVLLGAEKTLENFSPAVMVEYAEQSLVLRGYSPSDIDLFFKKIGYHEKIFFTSEGNKLFVR